MKIVKVLRKQCLRTGCKNKATHFGINGHRKYGLCDNCWQEWCGLLEDEEDKLDEKAYRLVQEQHKATTYLDSIPGMTKSISDGAQEPIEDCIPEEKVSW